MASKLIISKLRTFFERYWVHGLLLGPVEKSRIGEVVETRKSGVVSKWSHSKI